jgi:glycosyltransferase involved in cell wall biosynthesis
VRILVNATTCVVGGGVQVATAFINNSLNNSYGHDFHYAVSEAILKNLKDILDDLRDRIFLFSPSPAKIFDGYAQRKKLKKYEEMISPDVVFSVFGPSYVNFDTAHLCGFANPWMLFPGSIAHKRMNFVDTCKSRTFTKLRKQFLKQADGFVVETSLAKQALAKLLRISEDRIYIIPNGYHTVFDKTPDRLKGYESNGSQRILTISGYYPHKNLELIPHIARHLKELDGKKQYRFTLTLPHGSAPTKKIFQNARKLAVEDSIENVGPVLIQACPSLYAQSHIVLHPSLLEVFSVSYLEAMRMGRPIVATDLEFARETCGDAAVYYSPLSAQSAAVAIMRLSNNEDKYEECVQRGKQRIEQFPDPMGRYELQIRVLEDFFGKIA